MDDSITIITNNVPRPILSGYELTDSERAEFNYIDFTTTDGSFFRYKGEVYDLDDGFEYVGTPTNFPNWHGIQPDSFFSGILIRYIHDNNYEEIVVGRYYV
ncbi:MAG: hypothetical protein H0U23_04805 [Blastocatellia bacterium]|nr:hypothetical protein [Blastocatellia bacterium]